VSQGLDRVRNAARQRKKEKFTALLHHLTIDLMRDAFLALKRHAAPGVDGVTWRDYEVGLEGNLLDLHARVHRGTYRALPVRRRFIPKPGGKQRPLGIAALEDKIVQRASGRRRRAWRASVAVSWVSMHLLWGRRNWCWLR
jgi:retron-type reverse transcriptase